MHAGQLHSVHRVAFRSRYCALGAHLVAVVEEFRVLLVVLVRTFELASVFTDVKVPRGVSEPAGSCLSQAFALQPSVRSPL